MLKPYFLLLFELSGMLADTLAVMKALPVRCQLMAGPTLWHYPILTISGRCDLNTSHTMRDVDVQDGHEDKSDHLEEYVERGQHVEVVEGVALQPVRRKGEGTVEHN